jgi:hypothetical protein
MSLDIRNTLWAVDEEINLVVLQCAIRFSDSLHTLLGAARGEAGPDPI